MATNFSARPPCAPRKPIFSRFPEALGLQIAFGDHWAESAYAPEFDS